MFESWRKKRGISFKNGFVPAILSFFFVFSITACTPALYSVDLKHTASAVALPAGAGGQKFITTVATFNDARPDGNDLLIGRVITSLGGLTPVIPKNMKPTAAVATIVKDILVKSGYQVSVAMPPWNLQERNIRREWGRLLIGGSIDELEVVCQDDIPIKTYDTRAKVTIIVADVERGKIIHRVSTSSVNSLEHIYFSEKMLGRQISSAIEEAVVKALESPALKEKIHDVLR